MQAVVPTSGDALPSLPPAAPPSVPPPPVPSGVEPKVGRLMQVPRCRSQWRCTPAPLRSRIGRQEISGPGRSVRARPARKPCT